MSSTELRQLLKLLSKFKEQIRAEHPLGAQIIALVYQWIDEVLE